MCLEANKNTLYLYKECSGEDGVENKKCKQLFIYSHPNTIKFVFLSRLSNIQEKQIHLNQKELSRSRHSKAELLEWSSGASADGRVFILIAEFKHWRLEWMSRAL
ncbi:hypothetical protein KFK09_020527 [Dendrobium nobile]|uniref:Uncharacterized protein n=1 Tax=Dendrobium nobile TaxID=94219 RepID=A0A8T3AMP4_DENNO|nr:hypothetical protein KFK09_020527 [Dendrobium nobile]